MGEPSSPFLQRQYTAGVGDFARLDDFVFGADFGRSFSMSSERFDFAVAALDTFEVAGLTVAAAAADVVRVRARVLIGVIFLVVVVVSKGVQTPTHRGESHAVQ